MQLRAAKHHPAPAGCCCTDVGRPLPLQKAATDNSCGKHAAISRGAARLPLRKKEPWIHCGGWWCSEAAVRMQPRKMGPPTPPLSGPVGKIGQ